MNAVREKAPLFDKKDIYYGVMPLCFVCRRIQETVASGRYPLICQLQGEECIEVDVLKKLRKETIDLLNELSCFSDYHSFRNSALAFSVNNLICVFRNRSIDLSSEEMQDHYNAVQCFFQGEAFAEFANVNEDRYFGEYSMVYCWFLTIRNTPFDDFKTRYNTPFIVSLTSYPARINTLPEMLQTMTKQTFAPYKTVMWLGEKEFPAKEFNLPENLHAMVSDGTVSVRWCEDLKPHKKYFYAVQEYSDYAIITVDDDILYSEYLNEMLILSYIRHPRCVSSMRAEFIFNNNGEIPAYKYWFREMNLFINIPCMRLFATGVGGVLYPPGCLNSELLDPVLIKDLCLNNDDLWLKTIELLKGIPVVAAAPYCKLEYISGTQDTGLWKINLYGGTDRDLGRIVEWVDKKYGDGYFKTKIMTAFCGVSQHGFDSACACHSICIHNLESELCSELCAERMKNDGLIHGWSFRIGRALTIVPRRIRSLLQRILTR